MTVVTNPARTNSDEDIHRVPIPPTSINENLNDPEIARDHQTLSEESDIRLYEDETRSDVVFVAGMNGDTWRYPGHRRVLGSANPVFTALLTTKSDVIVVDHVDRRGFEQLLRYMYCEPTQLSSMATALCTLDAAFKFLCPQLTERCVRRLDEMMDASAALEIIQDLRYMCTSLPGAPSAPPLPAFSSDSAALLLAQCTGWCDSLAHNALLVIDEFADNALADEKFEELPYEDLALIVRRETLRVSSEMNLIEALSRWATACCKKTKRELTSSNKRAALGGLTYCPRYLLLQEDELTRALGLELLEPMERKLVVARARKLSAPLPVGAEQEALLRRWAKPRPTQPADLPVHLSLRSEPPIEEPRPSKLCARKPKRLKPPSFVPPLFPPPSVNDRKKRGCCASFGEGLLRAFICLFD